MGSVEQAQEHLDTFDATRNAQGDDALYIDRHTELTKAQLLCRLGRYDESIGHIDRVTELAHQSGDQVLRARALLVRAEVAAGQHDLSHFTEIGRAHV